MYIASLENLFPFPRLISFNLFDNSCLSFVTVVIFSQPVPTGQWIAIIERGQCRFSEKIRHAVEANATAVIIYDNEPNKTPLFMHHDSKNCGHDEDEVYSHARRP